MAFRERTSVSIGRPSRTITISLGEDAEVEREWILFCVGQALDMDAGKIASEHPFECWVPGVRIGPAPPDAPVTEKEAA